MPYLTRNDFRKYIHNPNLIKIIFESLLKRTLRIFFENSLKVIFKNYLKILFQHTLTRLRYKIAMRWRVEKEVMSGKGQFVCGEKRCRSEEGLRSWEVNFAYMEHNERKNALVKLSLSLRF